MSGLQRAIKIFAICLAIFIIVNIFGWIIFGVSFLAYIDGEKTQESSEIEVIAENSQNYVYTEEQVRNIKELDIDIKYAEAYITRTSNPDITIETNELENKLDARLVSGTLKIKEEDRWGWNKKMGVIKIYLPETINLDKLEIDTGAGKLTMDSIYAERLDLDQGAGMLTIDRCKFDRAEMNAGAGTTEITSSVLNNLKLEAGVRKSRN